MSLAFGLEVKACRRDKSGNWVFRPLFHPYIQVDGPPVKPRIPRGASTLEMSLSTWEVGTASRFSPRLRNRQTRRFILKQVLRQASRHYTHQRTSRTSREVLVVPFTRLLLRHQIYRYVLLRMCKGSPRCILLLYRARWRRQQSMLQVAGETSPQRYLHLDLLR